MIVNDDDNNNNNANDDNCYQTITISEVMHFREHLISEKTKFFAFTHVRNYWRYQVTTLLAYNASVMFLWHSCQSIMSGYNVISL